MRSTRIGHGETNNFVSFKRLKSRIGSKLREFGVGSLVTEVSEVSFGLMIR